MRKTLAAILLALGLASLSTPALSAVCGPVPALPDTTRRTEYAGIVAQTGPFNVSFQLYGDGTDYGNWLSVWVNGVLKTAVTDYTVTSPSGALGSLCLPISDAQVTFTAAQTGTIEIEGGRRPRRLSQFSENAGVRAHDLNVVLSDMEAQLRERWDRESRLIRSPPGEILAVLPPAASRANGFLGFDSTGLIPQILAIGTPGSGTVIGPLTSTAGHLATWNNTTGTVLADGGVAGALANLNAGTGLSSGAGNLNLASVAADRVLGNFSGSAAAPTPQVMPSCSGASSALTYNTSTHALGCGSITAVSAITAPAGRLTLVSGQPEMNTDVVGAQTLYYAPTNAGTTVPVLVSGTDTSQSIVSGPTDQVGQSLALGGSANWAADSIHDVFEIVDSGVAKLATRLWDSGMLPTEPQIANNVTITTGTGAGTWTSPTNAFNGTVNQTSVNSAINTPGNSGIGNCLGQDWGVGVFKVISKVILTSPTDNPVRGDAPTSLQIQTHGSSDNASWAMLDVRNINASTNNTSYTIPINQSAAQPSYRYHRICITGNGANAIRVSQIQFFNIVAPASGRRLSKYNGRLTNDASMTARTGAASTVTTAINEGTFLGTIHIDTGSNGQVTAHFSYGASRTFGVWNAYNQRTITVRAGIVTVSPYSYNLTTPANIDWGPMQGSSTFSMQVLIGYAFEPVSATLYRPYYLQASAAPAGYEAGIGIDNTASFSGTELSGTIDLAGQNIGFQGTANVTLPPYFGLHTLFAVEKAAYALGSGVLSLFTDVRNTVLTASWRG
jgi:hypothetical protein